MAALCLIPVFVSALLMGAHWLHAGQPLLAVVSLGLPLLLLLARRWVARVFQVLLLVAIAEWLRTMLAIVAQRQAEGQRFVAVVVILSSVALFTGLSALVFALPPLRRRYGA
jgi:hypothetical protein